MIAARAQGATATLSDGSRGTLMSTFIWSGVVFAVLGGICASFIRNPVAAAVPAAGSAATGLVSLALLSFFSGPPPLLQALALVIVPEAVSTAVLGFLILCLPRAWMAVAR